MERIVVAGAGTAGHSAATELRRLGYAGDLVVVGAEPSAPYRRPPLSKEYLTESGEVALALPGSERLDATWRLAEALSGLDVESRTVTTYDAGSIHFDGLVIATGAHARSMPSLGPDPRALTLRSAQDAATLRARLSTSHTVVIVGAGFLGSELAGTLRALGKNVSLVEQHDEPLRGPLGPEIARRVSTLHRTKDVDLHLGCGVHDVHPPHQ